MAFTSRWFAPAIVAAALGAASLMPAPAHAQSDSLSRALVDIANVVFQGGQPYDRYGNYGQDDRLVAGRDRYGRTVYYRVQQDPRYGGNYYGTQNRYSQYGNGNGYYGRNQQRMTCDRYGRCTSQNYGGGRDRDDEDDNDDNDDNGYSNNPYGDNRYNDGRYDGRYSSNPYGRAGRYVYDRQGRRRWVY